jgi:DNA-binding XRE family transcriptional regulator
MKTTVPFDLKALRVKLDITREQLADLLGVHLATVQRAEKRGEVTRTLQWAMTGLISVYFIRVDDSFLQKPELVAYLSTLKA